MGIETPLADRRGKEFCELPTVTNSNSKPRKNRRRQKKMSSPVQKLFETCKEVFASGGPGFIPPSEDIQRLQSVLGMSFFEAFIDRKFNFFSCKQKRKEKRKIYII